MFFDQARQLKQRLERPGQVNSLVQVALKLATPGVPDLYQGCELWDLSLVDPDNRRPVNFQRREELLSELLRQHASAPVSVARDVWGHPADGRCKLLLTTMMLRLRQARPELFRRGGYEPLELDGITAARGARLRPAAGRRGGGDRRAPAGHARPPRRARSGLRFDANAAPHRPRRAALPERRDRGRACSRWRGGSPWGRCSPTSRWRSWRAVE